MLVMGTSSKVAPMAMRPYIVKLNVQCGAVNPGEQAAYHPEIAKDMVARGEAYYVNRDGKKVKKPVEGDLPHMYGADALQTLVTRTSTPTPQVEGEAPVEEEDDFEED